MVRSERVANNVVVGQADETIRQPNPQRQKWPDNEDLSVEC